MLRKQLKARRVDESSSVMNRMAAVDHEWDYVAREVVSEIAAMRAGRHGGSD
jgi:hypothetical protein